MKQDCFTTPWKVDEWGTVQIFEDGDRVHTAAMYQPTTEDHRETTYIRYQLLVDRNARSRTAPIEMAGETFYGRLEHVVCFELTHSLPGPDLEESRKPIVLALIRMSRMQNWMK
ncbi:unnamed protein product [Somion occarium]|uniref:Uncharacterized protein n=1 Tax=Somion occarium TaxID=3059160 RepID=A0ABP1DW04_9APHY